MGAAQSSAKKEYGSDIEGIDLIDLIATKYILTQNFQDLKNLTKARSKTSRVFSISLFDNHAVTDNRILAWFLETVGYLIG